MISSSKDRAEQPCICGTLRKATRSVTQAYDSALRPCGLRATQFHILAEIRAAGEATVTDLTTLLLMDQTTLTRSLALLRRDGLLKTVPKPDARLQSVRLTPKGERTFLAAAPLWAEVQKELISRIGPQALAALNIGLSRLAQWHDSRGPEPLKHSR